MTYLHITPMLLDKVTCFNLSSVLFLFSFLFLLCSSLFFVPFLDQVPDGVVSWGWVGLSAVHTYFFSAMIESPRCGSWLLAF